MPIHWQHTTHTIPYSPERRIYTTVQTYLLLIQNRARSPEEIVGQAPLERLYSCILLTGWCTYPIYQKRSWFPMAKCGILRPE
jgi:hypothetical protein